MSKHMFQTIPMFRGIRAIFLTVESAAFLIANILLLFAFFWIFFGIVGATFTLPPPPPPPQGSASSFLTA